MKLGDLAERYGNFYTPRFRLQVGSNRFLESDGVVSDVSVDSVLDGADRFSFTLQYPFDHEDRRFRGLSWETFEPGTPVTVWMGYENLLGSDPTTTPTADPLLVGSIASVKPTFPAEGAPSISVSGFDRLHELTAGTNSDSWDDSSDSDVVTTVIQTYSADFPTREITQTDVPRKKIVQEKESDYRLLKRLADRNGFELFARLETFYFRPPPRQPTPELTLTYGDSLRSFSPELNDAETVETVEVRHWDETRKKEIVGKAKSTGGRGKLVLRRTVRSKAEADRVAEAALAARMAGELRGRGETVGLPELRVGEWVTLDIGGADDDGVTRFDGDYYVEEVTHRIGTSGYQTSFQVTGTVI